MQKHRWINRRIVGATVACTVALACALIAPSVHASSKRAQQKKAPAKWARCFSISGARYNINPYLLAGISVVESRGNPAAVSPSPAYGLLQVDHSWLPKLKQRFGFTKSDLLEPCTNIDVAAWILAHELKAKGDTWEAVGALNAACTTLKGARCRSQRAWYSWKVYQAMANLTPEDVGHTAPTQAPQ